MIVGSIITLLGFGGVLSFQNSIINAGNTADAADTVKDVHERATSLCDSRRSNSAVNLDFEEGSELRFEPPRGTNITFYSGGELKASKKATECQEIRSGKITTGGFYGLKETSEKTVKIEPGG